MLSRWIRNCCWRDINIWCVVGENDTIRRNLIECNFKQERSRFCLSFLSRGWASVLSAYRPRQRGMNLFNRDSYFFQKQKITTLPFLFFHYLNHLQFKFRKTEDNIVVETKIFNAHLHRDNDNVKAESSIFRTSTLRFLSNIIFDKEST